METTISAHGFDVRVVGDGFSGEEADFEVVASKIEDALALLPREAIEAIVWDYEADDFQNRADERAIGLANSVCLDTLTALGWDRPHVPGVSLYARPAQLKV